MTPPIHSHLPRKIQERSLTISLAANVKQRVPAGWVVRWSSRGQMTIVRCAPPLPHHLLLLLLSQESERKRRWSRLWRQQPGSRSVAPRTNSIFQVATAHTHPFLKRSYCSPHNLEGDRMKLVFSTKSLRIYFLECYISWPS